MKLTSNLKIEPSLTVAINSLALQKKEKGEYIYNLSAGEPMLPPHPIVRNAAIDAIKSGKTHYAPIQGIPPLLAATAKWMNGTYKTNYLPGNGLVTCGGKFGIYLIIQALLNPGDEVLVIAPYWVSYPGMAKIFGGKVKTINTSEKSSFKLQPADLEKAITKKSRLLILNGGTNPTGVLYSNKELKEILSIARKNDLVVISDEVYSGLVYDQNNYESCGRFKEHSDHVFVIQSCSKNFAMTGWRVGFVFGPTEIIKILTTLQGQSTTGTSTISQWAALAAVQNAPTIMESVRTAMQKRRDIFFQTLNNLFNTAIPSPDSSLYAFIPIKLLSKKHPNDSVGFCHDIMEQANIAAVPGLAFGQEGYVRFAFGEEEKELVAGLNNLRKYLT